MRVFAVVPAYNESAAIEPVITELRAQGISVVVVDDGSADNTADISRRADAVVVRHFLNRGQGAALQTGIQFALAQGAEAIVTYDADGQFQISDLSAMLEPVVRGRVDVTLGSRFLNQGSHLPSARSLLLRIAAASTRLYTGLKITDVHNGFRVLSRSAAEQISLRQDRMAHASELLEEIARLQLRYAEVPVVVRYTAYSLAKGQRLSGMFKIIWDLFWGRMSQ